MEPTSNFEVAEQAAKELGITQLVPAIYQDLLQPAAREAGQKLVVVAKAVGISLAPLEGATWGYQQIKDYLSAKVAAKLANKAPADIKPPERHIAGPVVMGMVFADQAPHLKEMYANLLATAMHSPSADKAHPSFVQIIQQLTPAEAQMLKKIATDHKGRSILFRETVASIPGPLGDDFFTGLPFKPRNIANEWQSLCATCGVTHPSLVHAFYRNLVRLGILAERIETVGGEPPDPHFGHLRGKNLSVYVELTEYGDLFLEVYVREA